MNLKDCPFVHESFKFVMIPCDSKKKIETYFGPKSFGLEDDFVIKTAKEYFWKNRDKSMDGTGDPEMRENILRSSPEERKWLADQMRKNNPSMADKSDDELALLFSSTLRPYGATTTSDPPPCDIHAAVVPTMRNGYVGVSLYSSTVPTPTNTVNGRATALLRACGHGGTSSVLHGDVFVGRYYDNENATDNDNDTDMTWKRVDLTPDDVDPEADWCVHACRPYGGGGRGGAPASLGGSLTSLGQSTNTSHTTSTGTSNTSTSNTSTSSSRHTVTTLHSNTLYSWTQDDEEVELVFPELDGTVTARDLTVKFGTNSLRIDCGGTVLVDGITAGDVDVSDSTYTLETKQATQTTKKELVVTLAKKSRTNSPRPWAFAVKEQE